MWCVPAVRRRQLDEEGLKRNGHNHSPRRRRRQFPARPEKRPDCRAPVSRRARQAARLRRDAGALDIAPHPLDLHECRGVSRLTARVAVWPGGRRQRDVMATCCTPSAIEHPPQADTDNETRVPML
eukprot:6155697-Prymnesium_polylepis.1